MRRGPGTCALLSCLLLAGPAAAKEPRPLRVSSKGITCVVELSPPGTSPPVLVTFEPGPQAWARSSFQVSDRTAIRWGRGFMWAHYPDTRAAPIASYTYLETEPLAGRTLEAAAKEFAARQQTAWQAHDFALEKSSQLKLDATVTLARGAVPGYRMTQQVKQIASGWATTAAVCIIAFEGQLVVITDWGRGDTAADLLKTLASASPKVLNLASRKAHIVDPQSVTRTVHFVVPLPAGLCAVPASADGQDKSVLGQWSRPSDAADPMVLTLRRLARSPTTETTKALTTWLTSSGLAATAKPPEPCTHGDREGLEVEYVKPAVTSSTRGTVGRLAAWKAPDGVYALDLEQSEGDGAPAVLAETLRSVAGALQTWSVGELR